MNVIIVGLNRTLNPHVLAHSENERKIIDPDSAVDTFNPLRVDNPVSLVLKFVTMQHAGEEPAKSLHLPSYPIRYSISNYAINCCSNLFWLGQSLLRRLLQSIRLDAERSSFWIMVVCY